MQPMPLFSPQGGHIIFCHTVTDWIHLEDLLKPQAVPIMNGRHVLSAGLFLSVALKVEMAKPFLLQFFFGVAAVNGR